MLPSNIPFSGRVAAGNSALGMQIEQQAMYTVFDFSLDSLAVTTCAGPAGHSGQQEGSHILFPVSATGSVSLCKLPYKRLPQAKAWLSAEVIEVTATPQHLQLLEAISKHQQQWHSTPPDAENMMRRQSQVSALTGLQPCLHTCYTLYATLGVTICLHAIHMSKIGHAS